MRRWLAGVLVALVGCSAAPPDQLTATLVSPTEISLTWQDSEPDAAGRVVEFATEPDGVYTILRFAAPGENTFTHADLMPRTPFYHRVRAYSGPVSRPVDVTLPEGELTERDAQDAHGWAAPRTLPGGPVATASIRACAAGAPADLVATVKHANGIWFTWTDRANDEEGFLVEARPHGAAQFAVAAVVDPDVNSYGLVTLPEQKRATYRVRAFYYGPASNVVQLTTGP